MAQLEAGTDEFLLGRGFTRRPNAAVYRRASKGGSQGLDINVQLRHAERGGHRADLYPFFEITIDKVNEVAEEMIGGEEGLWPRYRKTTVRNTIDLSAQKNAKGIWHFDTEAQLASAMGKMHSFLATYTLPMLDSCQTAEDLCDAYLERDYRTGCFWLMHVAAFAAAGHPDEALAAMERHFGRTSPRQTYGRAFRWLRARLP
jgi:hypothetical protein